jgi:hypothetical protein
MSFSLFLLSFPIIYISLPLLYEHLSLVCNRFVFLDHAVLLSAYDAGFCTNSVVKLARKSLERLWDGPTRLPSDSRRTIATWCLARQCYCVRFGTYTTAPPFHDLFPHVIG